MKKSILCFQSLSYDLSKDGFGKKWTCTAGVPASGAQTLLIVKTCLAFLVIKSGIFFCFTLYIDRQRPTCEYASGTRSVCHFHEKKRGDARLNT